MPAAPPPELRAAGNEPASRLVIDAQRIELRTEPGDRRIEAPTPTPEPLPAGRRWQALVSGTPLTVTRSDRLCADSMSGMPHPHSVSVTWQGRTLHGCGGEPATLLHGGEWVVEDLNRAGIIDRSRASLAFGPDGGLSGRASCNTYVARYALTGEGLGMTGLAVSRMLCASALMLQEQRFLDALARTERFEMTADGALVLHGAGHRILARRP